MLSQRAVPDFAGAALCNNLLAAGIHFLNICLKWNHLPFLYHTVKVSPTSCAVWYGFPVNLPVPYHTVKVSTGSCAVWYGFPVNLPFPCHTVKVSPVFCAVWYRNPVIIMLFSCFAGFFCRVVRKLIFLFFVFSFCCFSLMTSRVTYDANYLINRCLFVARSRLNNFRFVCGKQKINIERMFFFF